METKIALRLTKSSLSGKGENINHLIESLHAGIRAGAVGTAAQIFDRWQKRSIDSVLGKRYHLKKKRTDTPWCCNQCGNRRLFCRKGKRVYKRTLHSKIGQIVFPLYQVKCLNCGKVFAPVLEMWDVKPYQRYSKELLYCITRLAIDMPYTRVSRTIKLVADIDIHGSTIKRWVGRLGKECTLRSVGAKKDFILADSTRVKAGQLLRGEVLQVAMNYDPDKRKKELLGVEIGNDWTSLLGSIKKLAPKLIVTDGDDHIASAMTKLKWQIPLQRCQWHIAHQARHFLFRDGLPAKAHKPWLRKTKKILFGTEDNTRRRWERLIKELYRYGLNMTAAHFKHALNNIWTYRSFDNPVPMTTSLVEREMREINRRTDVGVRWSIEGVKHVLNLNLGYRYQHPTWKKLWDFIDLKNNYKVEVRLLNVNT